MRVYDNIPVEWMCWRHLLAEHNACHQAAKWLQEKPLQMREFLGKRWVNPATLRQRHDEVIGALRRWGYLHHTPFKLRFTLELPTDYKENVRALCKLCPDCRGRFPVEEVPEDLRAKRRRRR